MKIIYKPRRTGKTTDLIKLSHESGGYIVCFNQIEAERVFRIAIGMNCNIPFPISFDEFITKQYHGSGIKEFYIDNIDMCIQEVSPVPVQTITISKTEDQE